MWELYQHTAYQERWTLGYFLSEGEANLAKKYLEKNDLERNPNVPKTDWDYEYEVMEVKPTLLKDFMKENEIITEEKILRQLLKKEETLGGDDCYIGQGRD
jgi:hypothetical protein